MTEDTNVPQEHSDLIGGSTASRRINCPGSYLRQKKSPRSKSSSYANEGTAFHELFAKILDGGEVEDLVPFTHNQPAKGVDEAWTLTLDWDKWDELGQPALDALDAFIDELEAETGADFLYLIEESAEFPGVSGAFGTSDLPFRCGRVGGIIDWKMGRGPVDPFNNEQLMFYFAAVREKHAKFFEGVEEVVLGIIQPQTNENAKLWRILPPDIDRFIKTVHATVPELSNPDAEIKKGKWCDFADCKAVCELHRGAAVKLGDMMSLMRAADSGEHDENGDPIAEQIDTTSFLAAAMEMAEMAESWAKHIAGVTQSYLEQGGKVDGYKLVAKASSGRVWTADDDIVIGRLRSRGLKADDYYVKKVITPPAAEKILKKLGKTLPEDIVEQKPSSGYTLTRESDARPEKETPGQSAKRLGDAMKKALGE